MLSRWRRSIVFDSGGWRVTLLFLILCTGLYAVAFHRNEPCLLTNSDGTAYRAILRTQVADRIPFSQSGVDPLEANFDAWHPVFYEYLLPSALTALISGTSPGRTTTYTIYGVFMLLAAFACARSVGFDRQVALLGGFLLPVMSLPYFAHSTGLFYPLFAFNPHISQIVALSLGIVACFWALETMGRPLRLLLIPLPALCLMIAILSLVPYVSLMVPATAVYGGASLLNARRLRENWPRLVAALLMIALPVALGVIPYIKGLVGYSAYQFFSDDFEQTRSALWFASTVFWRGPFGELAIGLGLAGALWLLLSGSRRLRILAGVHIAATVVFLAVAYLITRYLASYQGPSPVYFEICFWPFSLFFGAVALTDGSRAVVEVLRLVSGRPVRWLAEYGALAAVTSVVALAIATEAWIDPIVPEQCTEQNFSPTRSTAISEKLRSAIGFVPGAPFRGFVATIDGVGGRPSVNWMDLINNDAQTWQRIGNEHRVAGLWSYGIPILFQYFTFITPPYYLMLTDFLSRPADLQTRSVFVLTQINTAIMRLWGVRYLITDTDTVAGTEVASIEGAAGRTLHLLELPDPNLGNWSPTEVRPAVDFHDALAVMHERGFDGRRTVVTDADLSGSFVAARDASLVNEKQGFHLVAESAGRSILVLPVQYSHCWTATGTGSPRIFRANIMQMGVAFEGRLDIRLTFRFGPIFAGQCRVIDMEDMGRLKIKEARGTTRRQPNQ